MTFLPSFPLINQRTYKPILWNLLVHATFLNMYLFVLNADILHPLRWFYQWYVSFIWQGAWLYIIPLTILVFGQGAASTEDYIQTQPFYPSRFSMLKEIFSVHNLIVSWLHISIGFLIPWIYASFIGKEYERFSYKCVFKDAYCFSEKRLVIILGCMWINGLYFFQSHFMGTRYLQFPVIPLPKLVLIKSHLLETIQTSMKWVLIPNILFMVLYYARGGVIREFIAETFSLSFDHEPIDNIAGLFNIEVFFLLYLFSTLTVVSMKVMELFLRICLTERHLFPFYANQDKVNLTLCEGLKMSEYPIIQHLAFLDLNLLSEHNKSRREEIFKLSSFGGHPHQWNAIKKECLCVIEEFCNDLETNMKQPKKIKPAQELPKIPPLKHNVTNYFIDGESIESPIIKYEVQKSNRENLTAVQKKIDFITNLPIIMYFFGDRKDMRIRHAFRLSLPIKWACESLSFLACHSLKEDSYGILVTDLPTIISSLLRVKLTLDLVLKHTMQSASLSRQDLLNITQGTALKKSVKRSIYRIVNKFKCYINDIQLPKDVENQLMTFVAYKD